MINKKWDLSSILQIAKHGCRQMGIWVKFKHFTVITAYVLWKHSLYSLAHSQAEKRKASAEPEAYTGVAVMIFFIARIHLLSRQNVLHMRMIPTVGTWSCLGWSRRPQRNRSRTTSRISATWRWYRWRKARMATADMHSSSSATRRKREQLWDNITKLMAENAGFYLIFVRSTQVLSYFLAQD